MAGIFDNLFSVDKSRPARAGSLRNIFGAPSHREVEERNRQTEHQQGIKRAAALTAIQNIPASHPLHAKLVKTLEGLGIDTASAQAMGKQDSPEEIVKLGRNERIGTVSDGQFTEVARGLGDQSQTTPTAAMRLRTTKVQDLMRLNPEMSERDAINVVDGNLKVSRPDPFGQISITDKTTGQSRVAKAPPSLARTVPPEQQDDMNIFKAAKKGTGPIAAVKQGLSNLFGFAIPGQIAPGVTEARNTLRLFNQSAKTAIVNNKRFPIGEQNTVQGMLPDPDQWAKDPDAAVAETKNLERFLKRQERIKLNAMNAPGITRDDRVKLSSQISSVRQILDMFPGSVGNLGQFEGKSTDQLAEIDPTQLAGENLKNYIRAMQAAEQ